MNMPKTRIFASIAVIFLVFCTQAIAQDIFRSSEFLKWSEENRSLYIRTSIGMAGQISGYNDHKHAKCLEDWYFSDEENSNETIYEAMRKFSNFHPRGVIMAVLKKTCGTFEYSARKNEN